MSRARAVVVCLALLAPTLAACDARDGFGWERMIRQPKFDAYEPAAAIGSGGVMRTPPAGTVPHDTAVLPRVVRTGFASDSTPVERIPIPVTRALVERGRDRFQIFCAVCHGAEGDGFSAVSRNMTLRPPASLHSDVVLNASDGHLFRVATGGYGMMPGYEYQLAPLDRWAVVAYVRALERSRRARLDQLPPEARDRALRELHGGTP